MHVRVWSLFPVVVIVASFAPVLVLMPSSVVSQGDKAGRDHEKTDKDKSDIEKFMKPFTEPCRIGESKPVVVKDAKFVLVAQTDWTRALPNDSFRTVTPLDIQLHISNLSKTDLLFPTYKVLSVEMFSSDGKKVKTRVAGDATTKTRPVLLLPNATYSLCRTAELAWNKTTEANEFILADGAGRQSITGPLHSGRYKLVFSYSVATEDKAQQEGGKIRTWVGEVATHEVSIQISEKSTRGFPSAIDQADKDFTDAFTDALRICESKPVTMNDVKFVTVAQADWRPRKNKTAGPLEIQLRITNLSKNDLVFPTFDTFEVKLSNADGKNIVPRGGRDATKITRPILLPPGTSYSLAAQGGPPITSHRRAELQWNLDDKAAVLHYYDGTGSVQYFGPLEPGPYKLAFWYGVSGDAPFGVERSRKTWLGNIVTEGVSVRVLAR